MRYLSAVQVSTLGRTHAIFQCVKYAVEIKFELTRSSSSCRQLLRSIVNRHAILLEGRIEA